MTPRNAVSALSAQNAKSGVKGENALIAEISAAEAEAAGVALSAATVPLSRKRTATMTSKKSRRNVEAPKNSPEAVRATAKIKVISDQESSHETIVRGALR